MQVYLYYKVYPKDRRSLKTLVCHACHHSFRKGLTPFLIQVGMIWWESPAEDYHVALDDVLQGAGFCAYHYELYRELAIPHTAFW